MAADHAVRVARFGTRSATSDQRPSADGGATRRLRNGRARGGLRDRRSGGRVNARSAWNVSLVTSPFQTRSHSASTVSAG